MLRGAKSNPRRRELPSRRNLNDQNNRNNGNRSPSQLVLFGHFTHACFDELICRVHIGQVPYFNAPIYLGNGRQIGKIDEIFGTLQEFSVSVRLLDPTSIIQFEPNDQLYIEPQKLMPMSRFLSKPMKAVAGNGRNKTGHQKRSKRGGKNVSRFRTKSATN